MQLIKNLFTDEYGISARGMFIALGLVTVLILGPLIALAVKEANEFERECVAAGGHTKNLTSVGTGVGTSTSGQPTVVTTTSTTTICLSADGRLLEVDD